MDFAIRFALPMRALMTLLGSGPALSGVRVAADRVEVRMGLAFRGTIPRELIVSVEDPEGLIAALR